MVRKWEGMTALMYAALSGNTKTIQALLGENTDIHRHSYINAKANDGETALMIAAREGHTEAIRELLNAGAYVNAKNNKGGTAYDLWTRNHKHNPQYEEIRKLLKAGTDTGALNDADWGFAVLFLVIVIAVFVVIMSDTDKTVDMTERILTPNKGNYRGGFPKPPQELKPPGSQTPSRPESNLICPHCQVKGKVQTYQGEQIKEGLSGGKIMGGVLTGGFSLLLTGLSRKHDITRAACENCGQTWHWKN
ncbi:MAG: ankyrin repeat domain-containing protein [Candidatus Dadabacteria bacterium]|nr:ankyrin repeat domain-containing protein [Candidatus Dadabacteria bacterium]